MNRSLVSNIFFIFNLFIVADAFAADPCSGGVKDPQTAEFTKAAKGPLDQGSWQSLDGVAYHYVEVNGKWVAEIDLVPPEAIAKAEGKKKIALQGFLMSIKYLKQKPRLPVRLCVENGELSIDVVGSGKAKVKVNPNGFTLLSSQGNEDVIRVGAGSTAKEGN